MSNHIYVKLKDAGTIFFDSSQDATVTGSLPVAVKSTKMVQNFIRNGNLIEVDKDEAEKLIANATKEADIIKKAHSKQSDTIVKELKAQLKDSMKNSLKLEEDNEALVTINEELSAQLEASADLQERHDALVEKQGKLDSYIKGLQTQIKNLKEGKEAADVPDPFEADKK